MKGLKMLYSKLWSFELNKLLNKKTKAQHCCMYDIVFPNFTFFEYKCK